MGLLSSLLLFPVTGPLRGIEFVVQQIQAEADATLLDENRVHAQLMNLNLLLDQGEISEEEYEEHEAALLERLNDIREYKESLQDAQRYDIEDGFDDTANAEDKQP